VLSSLLYNLSVQTPFEEVKKAAPSAKRVSVCDDLMITVNTLDELKQIHAKMISVCRREEIVLVPSKFKILYYCPSQTSLPPALLDEPAFSSLEPDQFHLNNCKAIGSMVGTCIPGMPDPFAAFALEQVKEICTVLPKLMSKHVKSQYAFQALRTSVAPRLGYLSRTLPPKHAVKAYEELDSQLRHTICKMLGLPGRLKAMTSFFLSMPLSLGGLGIRPYIRTATAAYYASVATAAFFIKEILPTNEPARHAEFPLWESVLAARRKLVREGLGHGSLPGILPGQGTCFWKYYASPRSKAANRALALARAPEAASSSKHTRAAMVKLQNVINKNLEKLPLNQLIANEEKRATGVDRTAALAAKRFLSRFHSVTGKYASAGLCALPISTLHEMSDRTFRMTCRHKLGLPPLPAHAMPSTCICGANLKGSHDHFLTCNRIRKDLRHDTTARVFEALGKRAGLITWLEPRGSDPNDERRTDLRLVGAGISLELDVSIVHPSSPSYLSASYLKNNKCAHTREIEKSVKHSARCQRRGAIFYPGVFESYGSFGAEVTTFCGLLAQATGDHNNVPVSSYLLYTRIIQPVAVSLSRGHTLLIEKGLELANKTARAASKKARSGRRLFAGPNWE
jgi:hypothetical protein